MEIFEIKLKTKTNPNIFVVKTDIGEFDFFADILVKNNIKCGEFNKDNFMIFYNESCEIVAYNLAVKYIGNRFKTEKQISDYLIKKNYENYIVEKVVKKLKDYSIINDKNYAESYIRANKNFSKNKLKQKLYSFGVSSNDLECVEDLVDDSESCVKHCEKFVKNKPLNLQTKDKLIRRLLGMGYGWETIKSSLKNFNFESEEN